MTNENYTKEQLQSKIKQAWMQITKEDGLISSTSEDIEKCVDNGNKTAAVRARKGLQEIKSLAQDIRVLIQDFKNKK